jgi:hypothetical protein
VADKDISSHSSRPTGDIATSGVGWIGIRKGLRSSARRKIAIVIEEEKFIKTTMSLRIDQRKGVIVFVTGRDEEIKLINSKIEKRTDIPAYQSRQTIYNRGDDEEPTMEKICFPVIVTRSILEAESLAVMAGDSGVVGLTALRVLPNFTLATECATRTVEMRT